MSGEATLAIKNGLQKAAKELIESAESKASFEKELDNLVEEGKITKKEADDVIAHLEEVAELDKMAQPTEIGKYGGKRFTASQIRKYRGELKQNGVEVFFEEDLQLNKLDKIKNKRAIKKFIPFTNEGTKFDTVQDFYFYMKQKGILGGFHAETKQLFLTEKPTEYLSFHEKMHVKHFLEVGNEYHSLPSWEKETYVFQEIWKQKHLWTKEELQHALDYVNGYRKKANQKLINYKI